ncbi:MAG TPA: Ig-like domain-containing protein, partial [Leptospiraceae bacterium]|nr:Ig-like domain-containing protein [Leptospiraceae bacterium]
HTPGAGASNVNIAESAVLIFSEPVDEKSVNSESIRMSLNGLPVSGAISVSGATVSLKPDANLSYASEYSVTAASSVRDKSGNYMKNDYTFTFTTSAVPDTVSPQVISTNPVSGSLNIDVNQNLQVVFSESIDPQSITPSNVTVNDGIQDIPIAFSLNADTLQITASPSLSAFKLHTLTLRSGIRDLAGNTLLFDYSVFFQTNDLTGPKVVSTFPKKNAFRFVPGNSIQIVFDEDIDDASVSSATVFLKQGAASVPGSLSVSGNTVTFVPSASLNLNTLYTMTAALGIRDISGNSMSADYIFSFTTYNPNIDILAGGAHTCFIIPSGTMRCTGYGAFGNLGYGDFSQRYNAASAADLFFGEGVKAVNGAAGPTHTCAVFSSGRAKCWGDNALGKLGYSSSVTLLNNTLNILDFGISEKITSLSAGSFFTCVLLETKKVRCFGGNFEAQLGYNHRNDIYEIENAPDLNLGEDAVQVAAGAYHTCVLFSSGNMRCFGSNISGQIGNGTVNRALDAQSLPNVNFNGAGLTAQKITLGGSHTCVLFTNKKVKCWGSTGAHGYPAPYDDVFGNVLAPRSDFLFFTEDIADISAGNAHTCVVTVSGKVKCWGYGFDTVRYGLGYGAGTAVTLASSAPDITFSSPAVRIFAGSTHTCALLFSGAVKCWGTNQFGQLGYDSSVPDITTASSAGDIYFNEP